MPIIDFMRIYAALATQLAGPDIATQWHAMGITPEDAARWANIGFMPGEAKHEMAAGVTLKAAEHAENRRRAHIWRNRRRIA